MPHHPRNAVLKPLLGAIVLYGCVTAACLAGSPQDRPASPMDTLPALRGDYFPLRADASGHDYHVHVRLPEHYATRPAHRWPLVVVLDGDSLFPLLAPTQLFLHYDEHLPEAIVVGIAYGDFDPTINLRHIDFSAPGRDTPEDEAGAPAFLQFLQTQLLPHVEQQYRVDPRQRVLVGQSRSAYFVLWSSLQAPDLFMGAIASNPAFSRSHEALFQLPAPQTQASGDPPALRVALVSGSRDTPDRMQRALHWQAYWQHHDLRPFDIRHIVLEGGTHAASIGEAYRHAMTWLFADDIAASQPAGP